MLRNPKCKFPLGVKPAVKHRLQSNHSDNSNLACHANEVAECLVESVWPWRDPTQLQSGASGEGTDQHNCAARPHPSPAAVTVSYT